MFTYADEKDTAKGIPGHTSQLIRDVASQLRNNAEADVYADLTSEGGMEFATTTLEKAKAFNKRRELS